MTFIEKKFFLSGKVLGTHAVDILTWICMSVSTAVFILLYLYVVWGHVLCRQGMRTQGSVSRLPWVCAICSLSVQHPVPAAEKGLSLHSDAFFSVNAFQTFTKEKHTLILVSDEKGYHGPRGEESVMTHEGATYAKEQGPRSEGESCEDAWCCGGTFLLNSPTGCALITSLACPHQREEMRSSIWCQDWWDLERRGA